MDGVNGSGDDTSAGGKLIGISVVAGLLTVTVMWIMMILVAILG